jgi:TonB family protein
MEIGGSLRRKSWMGLAFVIGLGFQAPLGAQTLSVVHAEPPQFTEVAIKARLSGTAVVWVQIHPTGLVMASEIEKNLPMGLGKAAQEAALRWRFEPSAERVMRTALLTFLFEQRRGAEPSRTEVTFPDPLTLRLLKVRSTVLWLPRENEVIPDKDCPVHGGPMAVERIPLREASTRYLSFRETPEDQRREAEWRAYQADLEEAERTLFPESHSSYPESRWLIFLRAPAADEKSYVVCGGPHVVPEEEMEEIYYCQACRDAEKNWRESHPEPPEPETMQRGNLQEKFQGVAY